MRTYKGRGFHCCLCGSKATHQEQESGTSAWENICKRHCVCNFHKFTMIAFRGSKEELLSYLGLVEEIG